MGSIFIYNISVKFIASGLCVFYKHFKMNRSTCHGKSVKELQEYFKKRGVSYTKEVKLGLVELCHQASSLGTERRKYTYFEM